ncbi:NAD-dependent epimerase/dehydratase family protein [Rhodomicrobium sp. Az07]|uniref:NAD-dependent epimerase/dehydratase family protein n=1 Tax=Rhodomicrobium sp. Az07 TaxID=2839034 RepID=UPI001BEA2808|nr:NAD-dependent epimerase/dehydratase family protein [Rhodomicrobium sp. Az07]MBT3069475.1 NAD-dependent epimerase/dehydratase family protein [Rhodomicrobium sp. Az07]
MHIIVTGGAGFIGTHLTRRLLDEGHRVTVIDNEFNSSRVSVPEGARFHSGDVRRPEDLEPIFAEGCDAVCHLAGQVSIIRAFENPVGDLRTNVEGTVNVVEMCLKHRVSRLIYASSMTAYGDTPIVPTPETECCRPDSYYGITKFAAERFVHATAARPDLDFAFDVTSFRMFSVFGPGQAWDNPYQGVLGIFLGRIQRGEPITIFGDGEQTRDFVFVDDIVDAWVGALDNAQATAGKVFNLGSGRSHSINELAAKVIAAHGLPEGGYDLRHAPGRPGEQRRVQADIRFARDTFGWEPRRSFEDGLALTMQWAGGNRGSDGPAARP